MSSIIMPSFTSKLRMDLSKDFNDAGSDGSIPIPKKMLSCKLIGERQNSRLNLSLDEAEIN